MAQTRKTTAWIIFCFFKLASGVVQQQMLTCIHPSTWLNSTEIYFIITNETVISPIPPAYPAFPAHFIWNLHVRNLLLDFLGKLDQIFSSSALKKQRHKNKLQLPKA